MTPKLDLKAWKLTPLDTTLLFSPRISLATWKTVLPIYYRT